MKKFLTVLLALSVVFTYTVGSAFAASGVDMNAKAEKTYSLGEVLDEILLQAQNNVKDLQTVKANFLTNYDANQVEIDGVTFSKAAVEKVLDKVLNDIATKINAVAATQKEKAIDDEKVTGRYTAVTVTTAAEFADAKKASTDGQLYKDDQGKTPAADFEPGEVSYWSCNKAAEEAVFTEKTGIDDGTKFDNLKTDGANVDGKVYKDSKGEVEVTTFPNDGTETYYICTKAAVVATYEKIQITTEEAFAIAQTASKDSKLYKDNEGSKGDEAVEFTPADVTYYKNTATPGVFSQAELDAYLNAVKAEYQKYDTAEEIQKFITGKYTSEQDDSTKYQKELLTAEHAVQKAEVVALMDKIDPLKYSDELPAKLDTDSLYYVSADKAENFGLSGEGYYSFRDQITAILAKARKALAAEDLTASDSIGQIGTKLAAITNEVTFFATYQGYIDGIPTILDEKWDKEDLAKGQERLTSAMKAHLADLKNQEYAPLSKRVQELQRKEAMGTALTTTEKQELKEKQAKLAALDGDYAAVEEVYANQIKGYNLKTVKGFFDASGAVNMTKVADTFKVDAGIKELSAIKLVKVEDLKAEADTLLKTTGLNGAPMYDKDAVEKALETAIAAVYAAADKETVAGVKLTVAPNYDLVKAEMKKVITEASFELNNKFYPGVDKWATTGYDDAKTKEVKSIIDATKTAIRSAKTVEAVDEAFLAGYTKYAAVPKESDRTTAQSEAAFAAKLAEYDTEIDILVDGKVTRYGGTTKFEADYPVTAAQLKAALKTGIRKAYTIDEAKSLYDEAAALVNGLKTKAERNAEVQAINDAVAAVKVPVTDAEKTTVLELKARKEAFEEYSTAVGDETVYSFRTLLDTLIGEAKGLDEKAITDAVAAIMKDGKVTLEEKEAVNAVVALVDAYAENYGEAAKAALLTGNVATVYEYDFTALEKKAVEDAIAVIDATAKPLDVKAIEAARAAYDALAEAGLDVDPKLYAKLIALENSVKEYMISSVEAMKITASSTAGKGYIKVKWTVKGDAAAADGYQVYRSTKRNSGFGTKPYFTTKNTTYKNTKSLKKGTRYYYKVRAYKVVDGKKIYSDWSNKAYRIAK